MNLIEFFSTLTIYQWLSFIIPIIIIMTAFIYLIGFTEKAKRGRRRMKKITKWIKEDTKRLNKLEDENV